MSMTHDEMIAVIQAYQDGKQIEYRSCDGSEAWINATPGFNFAHCEYRIKPEPPKPREWWIVIPDGQGPCAHCGWFNDLETAKSQGHLRHCAGYRLRHVREVLPEEEGQA